MNLPRLILPALLCLAPLPATLAASEPASCSAEQAEISRLQARVLELEKALRGPVAPVASAIPAAPAASPASTAAGAAPASTSGLAPKPAKKIVVVEEEAYSRSGCSPGLFQSIPYAKWMDSELWLELEKGMRPEAVESLLGPEHYDTAAGDNLKWEYGRCGARSDAQLLFNQGKLADWRAPAK